MKMSKRRTIYTEALKTLNIDLGWNAYEKLREIAEQNCWHTVEEFMINEIERIIKGPAFGYDFTREKEE